MDRHAQHQVGLEVLPLLLQRHLEQGQCLEIVRSTLMRLGYSIRKVNTVDLMDTVDFTELRAWHARDSRGEDFVPLLNNLKVLSFF